MRTQINTLPAGRDARKKLLRRFPGLLYRVVTRHGVDSGQVTRVFHGIGKSARVRGLILQELAEMQRMSRMTRAKAVVNV